MLGARWLLADKQKMKICKALKMTQCVMVKWRRRRRRRRREEEEEEEEEEVMNIYGSLSSSPSVSLSLSHIRQLRLLTKNKVWELYFNNEKCYGHSSTMTILHTCLHYAGVVFNSSRAIAIRKIKRFSLPFYLPVDGRKIIDSYFS